MPAVAFLPVAIPISSLSSRKQSTACTSSSVDLLHKQRFSICSLTFPPSSSKWTAVAPHRRRGLVVVACSSSSSPKNAPRPSTRLFVSGISFRTTEESLKSAFQKFGELMEVNIVMDRIANRPRGFAFLRYATEEESKKAIEGMHGKVHKLKDKFCQFCGGLTKQVIPDGEEKMRAVCRVCGAIHYENPKMVVGCLVEHDGKVLLCKRNIHPSYGLWTLPAGYLEIGESAVEGAVRETFEEANAEVEIISPFAQLDIPQIGQSYIIFRAKMKKPYFSPGPESLECMLFTLDDIPFASLAFSSIHVTLKMYAEDIKKEKLRFHYCIINKRAGATLSDPNGFDIEHHLHS